MSSTYLVFLVVRVCRILLRYFFVLSCSFFPFPNNYYLPLFILPFILFRFQLYPTGRYREFLVFHLLLLLFPSFIPILTLFPSSFLTESPLSFIFLDSSHLSLLSRVLGLFIFCFLSFPHFVAFLFVSSRYLLFTLFCP